MPRQHLTVCFGSGQGFCTVGARLQPILHRRQRLACLPPGRRDDKCVTLGSSGNFTCANHVIHTGPSARTVLVDGGCLSHPLLGLLRSCGSPLTASPPARGSGSRAQFRPGLIDVRRRLRQTMAFPSGRLRAWLADCRAPFFKSLLGVTIIAGSTRNGLGGRSTTAAVSDRHCIPCDYPRRSVTIAGTAVSRAETGRRPFLC